MAIDKELNLRECSVYSFTPDADSNPFEDEGNLLASMLVLTLFLFPIVGDVVWSFNYFFVEKKNVKRILLFTAHESMRAADYMSEDGMEESVVSYNDGEFGMEMMMEY